MGRALKNSTSRGMTVERMMMHKEVLEGEMFIAMEMKKLQSQRQKIALFIVSTRFVNISYRAEVVVT